MSGTRRGGVARARHGWLASLVWLALAGCKVVVLGDSNSCMWPDGCLTRDDISWAYRMTTRPDWPLATLVNRALPSMTAGNYSASMRNGEPVYGGWHLERLITEDLADACWPLPRRFGLGLGRTKLVIALGTNDATRANAGFAGTAVLALYERALEVPCVDVYVATIPPILVTPPKRTRVTMSPAKLQHANKVIALRVPVDHLIPFGSEPPGDIGTDGLHVTRAAQEDRADLALSVLFPYARYVRPVLGLARRIADWR